MVLNRIQRQNFYYPYKRGGYYYQKAGEVPPALTMLPPAPKPPRPREALEAIPAQERTPVQPTLEMPAAKAVRTRPRPRLKPRVRPQLALVQPIETGTAPQPVPTYTDMTEYVIGQYHLDCWIVEQEAVALEKSESQYGRMRDQY